MHTVALAGHVARMATVRRESVSVNPIARARLVGMMDAAEVADAAIRPLAVIMETALLSILVGAAPMGLPARKAGDVNAPQAQNARISLRINLSPSKDNATMLIPCGFVKMRWKWCSHVLLLMRNDVVELQQKVPCGAVLFRPQV